MFVFRGRQFISLHKSFVKNADSYLNHGLNAHPRRELEIAFAMISSTVRSVAR